MGHKHETRQKVTFQDVVDSAPMAVRMGTGAGRAVIAAAALGSGIAFLDGTVVNVALRTIGEDLDASLAQLQWITNGYLLSLASLILLGGSLGDRFGRRRVFVIGTTWFAAGFPAVRSRAEPRGPDRGAGAAGRRRRAADSGQPRHDPGRLRPRGPRARDRRLDRARPALPAAIGPFVGGGLIEYADWRLDLPDQPAAGGGDRLHRRALGAGDPRRPRLVPLRRSRGGPGAAPPSAGRRTP